MRAELAISTEYVAVILSLAAQTVMNDDPAIQASVLTYALHPVRSFPGDHLR